MDAQDRFADAVKRRLEALGMSAQQLEEEARLPSKYVQTVIAKTEARREPRINKVEALCALLDINFTFGETTPASTNPNHGEFEYLTKWGPEPVLDDLAFRHAWLKRLGIGAGNALTFTVPDSAMAPTLAKQDVVLINRGRTLVEPRTTYLFTDPHQAPMIRRLEDLGAHILAIADNPSFETKVFSSADWQDIRVIGEVVWSSRTIR